MWEQEEKIMQKVKTVKQEEPTPVRKETTRRTGLRDLSSSIYTLAFAFLNLFNYLK